MTYNLQVGTVHRKGDNNVAQVPSQVSQRSRGLGNGLVLLLLLGGRDGVDGSQGLAAGHRAFKIKIGRAWPDDEAEELSVSGRNLAEGVPRRITINSNEVLEALSESLASILDAVKAALEQTPPELCADVVETGIVLTGGGALLKGLDHLISEETGLPVFVADDPLTCVARGGGRALELMDENHGDFFTSS